jgi:hypothetical protein
VTETSTIVTCVSHVGPGLGKLDVNFNNSVKIKVYPSFL